MRYFYKTVFHIEVLSEGQPVDDVDLEHLNYLITDGDCSGQVTVDSPVCVPAPEMAKLLVGQGSDPEFFHLDQDGNDTGE